MEIRKKFVSGSIFAVTLFVLLCFIFFAENDFSSQKVAATVGFFAIAVIAIYNIIKDDRIISINKFHWFFHFVFLSISPACQYLSDYYPWGVYVEKRDILSAIGLVLLWDIIYMLLYRKSKRKFKISSAEKLIKDYMIKDRVYPNWFLPFVFALSIMCFLILWKMIGLHNLFFRSENVLKIENQTFNFIVRKILTAFPATACILFILLEKKNRSGIIKAAIFILILITICVNFPTSTTRYWMGTIYFGILFVLFFKRSNTRIIDYGFLFAILVIFPILYYFKTLTITDVAKGNINYSGIVSSFNTIDFDAFSMLARSVRYVRENGIFWGRQLLNVIFFFIPRSIWTSKPTVTSIIIASSQNQSYTNLSCPIMAEGYVNFGIIGLILYCFIYTKLIKFIDDIYWNESKDGDISAINVVYPFLCIINIYIDRGPLQPSFMQTIALMLSMLMTNMFSVKKKKQDEIK